MNIDRILPRWQILGYALGGGLIILLCFGLVYRPIWTAVNQTTLFPWGSDTLGHLLRYEYIRQNILAGEWYPQIMPEWYMGMQLLRYYAPLPYFCIYLLEGLLRSPMAAMHGFILFWTVFGGLSWLLFRRFIGAAPAVLSGVIYILLPDLIRVAFSEGNLPRVMAAGLTPLLLFLTLSLVKTGGSRMQRAGLALLFAVITLTHAMMAAIYAAALIFMVGLLWLFHSTSWRNVYQVVVWISLGIGAAGFWMLPSLTGGITELESGAVNRGFDVIAWSDFLNPAKRLDSIEIVYVSLSLLVAALACMIVPWTRRRLLSTAGASGIILSLLVTPQLTALFTALPLSALLWPVRFLGIASCFLLFVFTASLNGWWSKSKPVTLLLVGQLARGLPSLDQVLLLSNRTASTSSRTPQRMSTISTACPSG